MEVEGMEVAVVGQLSNIMAAAEEDSVEAEAEQLSNTMVVEEDLEEVVVEP